MARSASLRKLQEGDRVAVLSPSYAGPGRWPHVYELGVRRLRERFGLEAVAYPTTAQVGASGAERARDLVAAFEDPTIAGVISSLGGSDQVTYVSDLPGAPFQLNPKPYFGFSDNSHVMNHLWLSGVPSFYGGELFSQFAQTPDIDPLTERYLRRALFETARFDLEAGDRLQDSDLGWENNDSPTRPHLWERNEGWHWDGTGAGEGLTWGGCLESIDDMLRCGVPIPTLEQFDTVVLMAETSGGVPDASYVHRVYRALGERGVLSRVRAVMVGRPRAWKPGAPLSPAGRAGYRAEQRQTTLDTIRRYSPEVPVVQNVDFGHTYPQICIPYGATARVDGARRTLSIDY